MQNTHTKPIQPTHPKLRRRTAAAGISALIFVVAACGPSTSEVSAEGPQTPQAGQALAGIDESLVQGPASQALAGIDESLVQGPANSVANNQADAQSIVQEIINEEISSLSTPRVVLEDFAREIDLFKNSQVQQPSYRVMPQSAAGLTQLKDFNAAGGQVDPEHEVERFEQLKSQEPVEDVAAEVQMINR